MRCRISRKRNEVRIIHNPINPSIHTNKWIEILSSKLLRNVTYAILSTSSYVIPDRLRDKQIKDIRELASDFAENLIPFCAEKPYAVVGHSLGGLVAFEFVRAIRRKHIGRNRKAYSISILTNPLI